MWVADKTQAISSTSLVKREIALILMVSVSGWFWALFQFSSSSSFKFKISISIFSFFALHKLWMSVWPLSSVQWRESGCASYIIYIDNFDAVLYAWVIRHLHLQICTCVIMQTPSSYIFCNLTRGSQSSKNCTITIPIPPPHQQQQQQQQQRFLILSTSALHCRMMALISGYRRVQLQYRLLYKYKYSTVGVGRLFRAHALWLWRGRAPTVLLICTDSGYALISSQQKSRDLLCK